MNEKRTGKRRGRKGREEEDCEDSDWPIPGEPTNQYSNWSVNDKAGDQEWSLALHEDSDTRGRWTDLKVARAF